MELESWTDCRSVPSMALFLMRVTVRIPSSARVASIAFLPVAFARSTSLSYHCPRLSFYKTQMGSMAVACFAFTGVVS